MNEPSEEVKAMARRSAAKYWQTGDPSDEATARSILSGEWDDQAYTQAALAAILETTELTAAFIEREGMTTNHAGIPVMAEVNQRLATEIRTGTHYGKAEQ